MIIKYVYGIIVIGIHECHNIQTSVVSKWTAKVHEIKKKGQKKSIQKHSVCSYLRISKHPIAELCKRTTDTTSEGI